MRRHEQALEQRRAGCDDRCAMLVLKGGDGFVKTLFAWRGHVCTVSDNVKNKCSAVKRENEVGMRNLNASVMRTGVLIHVSVQSVGVPVLMLYIFQIDTRIPMLSMFADKPR